MPSILPKAILFDMDGTITEPMLDFPRIKAEMGIGTRPILEALAEMDGTARRAAEAVLLRHEEAAALASRLNPGCDELLALVARLNLRSALITRNSRASVRTVLRRHELTFAVLVAREDVRHKPHPQPLLRACEALAVSPDEAWMVGDGQYDVEAGIAAGVRTVWLSHGRPRPFVAEPWRVVADLSGLTALLLECHGS